MATKYPLVLNGTAIQELQSGDVLNGYVTLTSADTLTNKTLTTPVLTNPTVTNYVETAFTATAGQTTFTVIIHQRCCKYI